MIQIENINVSYQQTLALDNITLNLEGPSITGIIGPNGAGKSTLIKALIGIIPHSGKILFNKQTSQTGAVGVFKFDDSYFYFTCTGYRNCHDLFFLFQKIFA